MTSTTVSGDDFGDQTESFTYSDSGRDMLTQTDALGLTTTYNYEDFGMLEKVTDPFGLETSYTYDNWNRMSSQTDYLGNTTTINFQARKHTLNPLRLFSILLWF